MHVNLKIHVLLERRYQQQGVREKQDCEQCNVQIHYVSIIRLRSVRQDSEALRIEMMVLRVCCIQTHRCRNGGGGGGRSG